MGRPLWPDDGVDDEQLLAAESWGAVFDRWTFTARCFVHRLLYDQPGLEQYVAHRLVLMAAACAPSTLSFERTLSNEIVTFLNAHLPGFMAERGTYNERLRRVCQSFTRLSAAEQVAVTLYDYQRSGTGRHEQGAFDAVDLGRLLGKSPEAARQLASRAMRALRNEADA